MKLLLDENLPQKVFLNFPEHTILTVERVGVEGTAGIIVASWQRIIETPSHIYHV